MKDKKRGKSRKRKQAPFLVLPLIDVDQNQNEKMPTKNPGLRLFTKTWVPKIKEEEMKSGENLLRPLTATLEKPQVLDISFITKIDMSLMRKEFLSITNLCRVPLNVSKARRKPLVFSQRRSNANRPLSLPSNAQLKKPSRPTTSEDSWEDETESRSRSSAPRKIKMNKAPPSAIPKQRKTNAKQQNDANNNHKAAQNRTKLPEPCKTCGRPNQPERFHSHPVTPTSNKKMEEAVKIPVKNTVQKPVAIKYQSKKSATPPVVKAKNTEETTTPRMPSGKGPRTLTCYICGREFGTKSLPLHEPKCMEKWKRENESLPQHLQRKSPIKPDHPLTRDEWNAFAWESSQSTLVPCHNCGRTFYPDRLAVHQRSCKPLRPQHSSTPTSMVFLLLKFSRMTLEKSKSIEAELQTISMGITDEDESPKKSKTLCQNMRLILTNITVEPIMICYIIPNVMASLATQNLSLEKACRVNLGYSKDLCDSLSVRNISSNETSEEVAVQKLVASMNAYKNVVQSLLPSLLLMFLGSWSDRHNRRKPCILLPMMGEMVACTGFILCTYFFYELRMEFNLIAEAVPPALTGGWFSLFLGVYAYIGGICGTETRTLRIGAVSMFSNISITIGIALSGILYKQIGFYGVFSLALSMYTSGVIYGWIRMKEQPNVEKKENGKNFLQDFFDLQHISETFQVAFKDGKRNRKKRICTILVLVMVIIGPLHGEMNVMYLFVRYKFKWDEMDYSMYSTFNFLAHMMGTLFSLMFFSKFMKFDDALLGMISSMSKIFSCLVYAFAPTPTIFYLGAVVEMFNGTSFIAMRSIMSKLVPPEELGKINSLFGVSEALMPLIYGPMYSMMYKATINYLPGSFFLLGGALTTPAVIIFFWLYAEHRRDLKEEELEKAQQEELLDHNNASSGPR